MRITPAPGAGFAPASSKQLLPFSFSLAEGAVESRFEPEFDGLFIYPIALPGRPARLWED
jgi:hypothetical protein